ncbi:hypothetical protein C7B65_15805 [Phormidesmis priestleyi ULC007]|uniref:Uncharacterized protein n=1 Tax=Phormidesmis priestleyi ULC007 TaxID=1920490 RepID=A0A2T1DCZ2_9CYAN|nr:hypothetical protein [Phormidesmis priestleyi]PSB18359.1 hypothetical protein C7B65_15805 [Phormidesmis priestleyi ULC007]PZO46234.1 MAG: hypothetical protein DCF14_23290 [Phormidesmis priestleyi]
MTVRQPRYSKEELAQRAHEIYESQVRAALQMPQGSQVEADNFGKIVAINIETEAFAIADDILTATNRLFERLPDAQPFVRIGHRAVHRFGARSLRKSKGGTVTIEALK